MIDLLDELKELHQEVRKEQLQKAWDKYLVLSFYRKPKSMWKIVDYFCFSEKITKEEFEELIVRRPMSVLDARTSVPRFFAVNFARFSDLMYDHTSKDISKLSALFAKQKMVVNESEISKMNKDKKDRFQTSKDYARKRISSSVRNAQWEASAKANWKVCK